VLCQIRDLQTHPIVAAKLATGKLRLYGWVYNVETGSVETYDGESCRFVPLTLGPAVHATPKSRAVYGRQGE
jgi:carbonic anhydrase